MNDRVKSIPDGYRPVSPYLIVDDTSAAIEFYANVFGAEETIRVATADDKGVMHAEIRIRGDVVMLGDANPDWGLKSPKMLGGSPVSIYLYVEDADASTGPELDTQVQGGGSRSGGAAVALDQQRRFLSGGPLEIAVLGRIEEGVGRFAVFGRKFHGLGLR